MPLPLPPPPPLTRPVLRTVWGFDTTPKACTMSARASQASLLMIVRPEGPLRLVVSLPAPAPPHMAAHFAGPAGQWTIAGDGLASGQAVFYLPRNETTLGRILMLLSGGTLELRADTPGLPILSLPESGDAGREWFACARHSVTGL
ncbi:MAG TPA: hypothetical protein VMU81_16885 [Acetobacteraceae bacterium]|jgi:hypothetical protein|nr:hypothetical protein [Acetobacteraceae bacterium]